MITPYQMAIANTARAIRKQKDRPTGLDDPYYNAFDASKYLAIAFCKLPEDVLADILL